jgi:hypothetical protein
VLALVNLEATAAFGALQKLAFRQCGLLLGYSSVLAVLSAIYEALLTRTFSKTTGTNSTCKCWVTLEI